MSLKEVLVADLRCSEDTPPFSLAAALPEGRVPRVLAACLAPRDNLPAADFFIPDLGSAVPHLLLPKGAIDLLLADPESGDSETDEVAPKRRNHPWYVAQWATQLRIRRLIVVSSPGFVRWSRPDLSPGPTGEGAFFSAWLNSLRRVGFRVQYQASVLLARGDGRPAPRFLLIARAGRHRSRLTWPTEDAAVYGLTPFIRHLFAQ